MHEYVVYFCANSLQNLRDPYTIPLLIADTNLSRTVGSAVHPWNSFNKLPLLFLAQVYAFIERYFEKRLFG